jgi:hypothetical protein
MEVHTQASTEIHETQPPEGGFLNGPAFQKAEKLRPWIQWGLVAVMGIVTIYLSFRDTNAEQGTTLKDLDKRLTGVERIIPERSAARDRQIQDLKTSMVTNELFNERTDNITDQLREIKADQKEILNRLPVRIP